MVSLINSSFVQAETTWISGRRISPSEPIPSPPSERSPSPPPDHVWMLQDWMMTVVPLYEYCGMFGTDKGHTWSCSNGDRLTFDRVYFSLNILLKTLFGYVFFYQTMERRRKRLN